MKTHNVQLTDMEIQFIKNATTEHLEKLQKQTTEHQELLDDKTTIGKVMKNSISFYEKLLSKLPKYIGDDWV